MSTAPSLAPTTAPPTPGIMSGCTGPRPPPTTSSGVSGQPLRGGRASRSGQPGRPYAPSYQYFEGETEALKGHVYDLIGSKSANLFIMTTKQMAGFVGCTYTQGGDICLDVENLALPTLEGLTAPNSTDALAVAIFHEEVQEFIKRTKTWKKMYNSCGLYYGARHWMLYALNWRCGMIMRTCDNIALGWNCSMS